MKLKSLFLTSLAALALGACSNNDNDAVSNVGEKNFAFSITMPAAGFTSRADSYTAGAKDWGTVDENNFVSVDILVGTVSKSFVLADFTKTTDATAQTITYTLNADKYLSVAPGTYACKAIVNAAMPTAASKAGAYATIDGIVGTGDFAAPNNFIMTGTASATVTANQTSTAVIPVDRIAAKLETVAAKSTGDTPTDVTSFTNDGLTFTILNYTFLNLNKTSNYWAAAGVFVPTATTGYFQYCAMDKSNAFTYPTATAKTIGHVTYCLENGSTVPTKVVYAVKVSGTIGSTALVDGANFYKVGNTVYPSFAALDAANAQAYSKTYGLSDTSSFADFNTAGVQKFTAGVCYYVKDIKTVTGSTSTSTIARNNWYKLRVTNISGIGSPVVDPPTPPTQTLLSLQVVINPWAVNVNDFDL